MPRLICTGLCLLLFAGVAPVQRERAENNLLAPMQNPYRPDSSPALSRKVSLSIRTGVPTVATKTFSPPPLPKNQTPKQHVPDKKHTSQPSAHPFRIGLEQLRNPYWYEAHGNPEEARQFWDKKQWEQALKQWANEGYNAILYWAEPWQQEAWQTFLIPHNNFPEARELTAEQSERIIRHVNWIFRKAHEFGLKNFLFTYFIVTTRPFARAHGMDREMPLSASVDYRHNLKEMGFHFGVRNDLTRAFTEAAIAELFQTYPALDGLNGAMAEALPGKKSMWYKEAVTPGLKRSGRRPLFIVSDWMLPLEDFRQDIAPREVYANTWLSLKANGEMFTDAKPYPKCLRWAEQAGVPAILEIMNLNFEAGFPCNSPRLAYEILNEYKKVANYRGYLAWYLRSNPNDLFRKALGYYGKHDVPYSDKPWLDILEARFGDRQAAEHLLRAYDAAARITPEVGSIAWCPQDLGVSHQLLLPYWYWSGEDPRWSYLTSPTRGGVLLPLRYYASVVAKLGDRFQDNDGTDHARNTDHPGTQELIWGLGDYPITPEKHMRHIRQLGETCLREAEAALKTVTKNKEEATTLYNYMKAYKLLTDYYEHKVLAAVSALIYSFGGAAKHRAEAERLGQETLARYQAAITFIWENIDKKSGNIKARWNGKTMTLPELIENEKQEQGQLARLFHWPPQ